MREIRAKVVIIGDVLVGKTTIRSRYMGEGFVTEHIPTLGANFAVRAQMVADHTVTFAIWDLAGHEVFHRVRSSYYQNSAGGLLVFDVTMRESFDNLQKWVDETVQHSGLGAIPLIILANKTDLDYKREVTRIEVDEYMDQLNQQAAKFGVKHRMIETSAKTGENIVEAFRWLGEEIIERERRLRGKK